MLKLLESWPLFVKRGLRKTQFNYAKMREENRGVLQPPARARGMTALDRGVFETELVLPCLDAKDVVLSLLMPLLKKYTLKLRNFKAVRKVEGGGAVVVLDPNAVKTWGSFDVGDGAALERLSLGPECLHFKAFAVNYGNYTAQEVLRAILPGGEEGSSSFTTCGHVVHVNLREHLLAFKGVIGEVLLDKVPNCRTVVNKIDAIDNAYRNFKMEVLCGDADFAVEVKENGCRFRFDYSSVYWNSRLATEHERVVKMLKAGDVLFDVFCGVGPFAVPAAKKKCVVFANDLNPESYKWLNENAKLNKVPLGFLRTFNVDARDFIANTIRSELPGYLKTSNIHITMNLPALAVDFLSAFVGLLEGPADEAIELERPPLVHVYCFTKGEDYVALAKKAVCQGVGFDVEDKIVEVFRVRTVSSLKEMMRVSFKLDEDVLLRKSKKRKLDCSLKS